MVKSLSFLDELLEDSLPLFFKFSRVSPNKLSIKIMSFLFSIAKHDFYSKLAERFLNLFYDYLNSIEIFHSKTSEHIFNLVYNIVKEDYSFTRAAAFVKRLFQVCIHCNTNVILGTLILFSKTVQIQPGLINLVKSPLEVKESQNNEIRTDSEEHYEDAD